MNKLKLQQEITDLEEGLPYVPENMKAKVEAKLAAKKQELADLGDDDPAPAEPAPAPAPAVPAKTSKPAKKPAVAPAPATTDDGDYGIGSVIKMLETLMSGGGMNIDSFEVRNMIKEYLDSEKVQLNELDQQILDEIKKHQRVVMELPNYGLKIEISADDATIPNLYSIIDDALAGNNIFLIGEAGGGKTYTAEKVAEILSRKATIINCSQYTSPTEILGGQTIEGYKEGKLIRAWREGELLILDEMPKLDPNTAGLFNDALAKASKTRPKSMSKINSTNPEEEPVERNDNFACIATGNIYPNANDARRYVGNNQQDLSLLDRFSGSVYFVEFSDPLDQSSCRYNFLYQMLVGNFHEYIEAKREGNALPEPKGLRTIMESLDMKNYALVSYRTLIAFRVAFEYELVRAIAKKDGKLISDKGKTVASVFESYLVAFPADARKSLINTSKITQRFIENEVRVAIDTVLRSENNLTGYMEILAPKVRARAAGAFDQSKNWSIAESFVIK